MINNVALIKRRAEIRELKAEIKNINKSIVVLKDGHEREINKYKKRIENWKARVHSMATQLFRVKNRYNAHKKVSRTRTKKVKNNWDVVKKVENELMFFVRDREWKANDSKPTKIEFMVRAIVGYTSLSKQGVITYNEFALLLTGSHITFFTIDQVKERFPDHSRNINSDLKKCIEVGYFRKIPKKNLYAITYNGTLRVNAILDHIYDNVTIFKPRLRTTHRNESSTTDIPVIPDRPQDI